jgi:hypothetical protein
MSNHEAMLGIQWLENVLKNDATLAGYAPGGVWRGYVPPGTPWNYVVYNFQAGSDVLSMNAVRLFDKLLYQVIISGPGSSDNDPILAAGATEIDNLLKRPAYAVTPDGLGAILAAYRETPIMKDAVVNGEKWTDVGGLYRVELQQIG